MWWLTPKRIGANRWIVRAMLKTAGMRGAVESGRVTDELIDWLVAELRATGTFGDDSLHSEVVVAHFGTGGSTAEGRLVC